MVYLFSVVLALSPLLHRSARKASFFCLKWWWRDFLGF